MKRTVLISVMMLLTLASFGRKHIENATVVADTLYYSDNLFTVINSIDASYYRLLMTQGAGIHQRDVFQDFYLDGTIKAEGGYNFVDLSNDKNSIFEGEVTTYYKNGKEKWHGKFVNGKRHGYFTMQMRDGSVAVALFDEGVSVYRYFTVTHVDGTVKKRPISDLKSLL